MRLASLMRPVGRVSLPPPPPPAPPPDTWIEATSADALSWTWTGDAVTGWRIKWGTTSGAYTETYDVADPHARAVMFDDFLASSGDYYIAVFAVDAGGEGEHVDEVAISYTA